MLERKKALFGVNPVSQPHTSSTGGLQAMNQVSPTRNMGGHMRSMDNNDGLNANTLSGIPSLNQNNSNSNLNINQAPFNASGISGTGSQDSGAGNPAGDVIETPYSRVGKRRMGARPPTQSGLNPNQQNDAHMQSVNSQRPHTGPASRPPRQ